MHSIASIAERRILPAWTQLATTGALGPRLVSRDRAILCVEHLPAEDVFFLARGCVELYRQSDDGWSVVTKILKAPALFAAIEAVSEERVYLQSARALRDVETYKIASDAFRAIVAWRTDLTHECLVATSRSFCRSVRFEHALLFETPTLLANHLLAWADLFGHVTARGVFITINRTQGDLANAVGVALRSVARTLRAWRAAGWVSTEKGRFVLLDVAALRELAAPLAGSLIHDLAR